MKKNQVADVRRKAEELLKTAFSKTGPQLPEDQVIKLVQEMEVLQVELELQNEELAQAKVVEEINAAKYRALFDNAPSGYFTLDRDANITEVNHSGAKLLGKDRNKMKFSQFRFFVSEGSKNVFNLFFEKVWSGEKRETCEIVILENQDMPVYVHVDGAVLDNGNHCLITLTNISERINAENELRKEVDRTKLLLDLFTKAPLLTDNELYGEALDMAVKVTGSKIGFLHKISADQQEIVLTVWSNESGKNPSNVDDGHFPIGLAGNRAECVMLKQPVVKNDFASSPKMKGMPDVHAHVNRTLMVPVVQDEKVHLILGAGNKPIDYGNSDVVQIQHVANEFYKILEKRKVEVALRESENKAQKSNLHLRSILESPQGIIIFSLDLNYCYTAFTVSHLEVMKAIWGVTIEVGMNFLEAISFEEDRLRAKNNFDRVYQGEYFIVDEAYGDKNLFRTFWENRYSPIYDDSLKITGLTVFVTEITERRRAEEDLRKSEEKYRNIFENVYDVYYEALLDGTILEISPSIETISKGQFTRNELIGKSIVDFYAQPEERNFFFGELEKYGRVTDFELSLRNRDGSVMPISITSGVRNDATGRTVIIGSMRDVTDRKKAEKLIAQNNKDLQFLNSFALNLSRLASSEPLAGFFIRQLKGYTAATIVAYSEYDEYNQTLATKIIETDREILDLIFEVTGSDLLKLKSPVSKEIYLELVAHNIHKHGTFTEASFGAIPLEADLVFRERSGIKNIYGIALTIGEELYGTLLLCFKEDVPASLEELMQSFANLSAVALMRKMAEDALKLGYDQLEQKVVERTLELNQLSAFNKAIVSNAGVTVISTSNTGTVVSFNPAAEQMLGYDQAEVVGTCSILRFFDQNEILSKAKEYGTLNKEDGTIDFETYIDFVIEHRPDTFEWKMVRKDGSSFPVLLSLDWLKGSDGWNTGYVGVATDITLRKQTEDALRISEKNLAQITDSVPIFIALLNKDLEYIFTNKAYERFLNLSKSELLGRNVKDVVGFDVFERAYPFLSKALEGETNTFEIRFPRADGQERILLVTYLPYYQGITIFGVLATIIDITERIVSEELLRKKEVENLAILKAVPDLFFKLDKTGKFMSFHSGKDVLLYVSPDKFLGMNIHDVMPPEISSLAFDAMNEALQTHEMVSFEYELQVNGENRFFEDRVLNIDEEEILMIIRDITDRKITEKALSWNESLLKKVTESSPLGFLVVDNRTDEILYFNHNFCKIWGILHLEERIRNKELKNNDIIPDCLPVLKDVTAFAESCKPLQDENNRITIEDEIPFIDGRTIRRFSAQIRDIEDQYNGRLYIFEDISLRKTSEEIVVIQRDLATGLSATSDLSDALKLTLKSILKIKNVEGGGIYLMNSDNGILELKAHEGLSDQFIRSVGKYGPDSKQVKLVNEGIPIYGLSNLVITDSALEAEQDKILSVAVIPIQHEGKVIGAINMASKTNNEFYVNTHLSLEAVALQLGGTISRIFTERALFLSQQNFKKLFDTIDDFLFILDNNGNIMIVNSVVETRLGYTSEELKGVHVLGVHPPERREEAGFIVGEMIAGRISFCPVPLYTKQGKTIPVETRVVMGKWDNKDVLFGISRDITERQKAQQELELRESYLSAVINNHPGMFWLKDLNGRFLIVNSRNDQYLKNYPGPNKLSIIGLTDFDIFPTADAERYRDQDEEIIRTLLPGVFEIHDLSDNKSIWYETNKFPVLDRVGAVIGISGYATEITQRKQVEAALKMQSAAFESFALAIIITDIQGKIQWANSAFARLTGYELSEILGNGIGSLVKSGEQPPEFYQDLWKTISSGKVWSSEIINKRKDNTFYPEEQTITPIVQNNGEISGFIAIKIDITKRKQLEDSLIAAIAKEKELNDLKSRFVSMASHEFRTPLASILITDESLISYWRRMSEEQIINKLQNVKDQVLHLTNIVNEVMQVSKIQEGQVPFNPQMVELVSLCQTTIENFNSDVELKNKIEFESGFKTFEMYLDLRLIRQVLNNLISNALKYSLINPVVKVGLYQEEEQIFISVQDNGIGIPEADQKYLFQPFYRAGNVKQIQGTGLGLNIVKDAVRLHNGKINFVSLLEKGTTFVVQLPIKLTL